MSESKSELAEMLLVGIVLFLALWLLTSGVLRSAEPSDNALDRAMGPSRRKLLRSMNGLADTKTAKRAAAIELGRRLFSDSRVCSLDGTMSCASCHNPNPKLGWSNGQTIAVGRKIAGAPNGLLNTRNVPTLDGIGRRKGQRFDLDGRQTSIVNTCIQAVTDPTVFGHASLQDFADRAAQNTEYERLSRAAFKQPINAVATVGGVPFPAYYPASALAYYVETIDSGDLPADRLAAGLKTDLPKSAIRGWALFKKHCASCHVPENNWTDDDYHDIGLAAFGPADLGRSAVTGNAADDYKFATPSLRLCSTSQPFMHNGCLPTRRDVVAFKGSGGAYVQDGQRLRRNSIDPLIKKIRMNESEQADVVDFLTFGFQNPLFSGESDTAQR